MRVKSTMTTDVRTCSPDTTVAEAAQLMDDLAYEDVVQTLRSIYGHHHPVPHVVAA